jgi:urea carboxylase
LLDLTPGIRSLQIHFDPALASQTQVLDWVLAAVDRLPSVDRMRLPSQIVHLPLSWDVPATQLATERYQQSVRADAPWCPDNIEFIRRINGLASREQVRDIVFGASYLVMGLGDVYLGAPVATPLDPRHRLVTTKYNPARLDARECGGHRRRLSVRVRHGRPGGYQFVGRTVQMWNRYQQPRTFAMASNGCCFFDQIRFYPVSSEELLKLPARRFLTADIRCVSRSRISILATTSSSWSRQRESIDEFRQRQRSALMRSASAGVQRGSPRHRCRERSAPEAPHCPRLRCHHRRFPAASGRSRLAGQAVEKGRHTL